MLQPNTVSVENIGKTIFEGSSDAIIVFRDYKVSDINRQASSVFKCSKEQMLDLRPWDFSPPRQQNGRGSREYAIELIDDTLSSGRRRFPWKHLDSNGDVLQMDIALNRVENERNVFVAVLKTAEDDLWLQNEYIKNVERLKIALKAASVCLWEFLPAKNELNYNSEWYSRFGYGPDDLSNEYPGWLDLIHPEDKKDLESAIYDILSGFNPKELNVESRIKTKDGKWGWLRINAEITERDKLGKAVRIVGLNTDVGSEKNNELSLVKMSRALDQSRKMATFGCLTSAIAHEIRQPLNSIKIISETSSFAAKTLGEEAFSKYDFGLKFKQISEASTKIEEIIRNLKSLFTLSGSMENHYCNLNDIINNALRSCRGRFEKSDIELECDIDYGPVMVKISPIHVFQILVNLINNAADSLLSSNIENMRIKISFDPYNMAVSVIDNGPGFDREIGEKLFGPFFSTKGRENGMGMGLHISRTMALNMGGDLTAYSKQYEETVFKLDLPK